MDADELSSVFVYVWMSSIAALFLSGVMIFVLRSKPQMLALDACLASGALMVICMFISTRQLARQNAQMRRRMDWMRRSWGARMTALGILFCMPFILYGLVVTNTSDNLQHDLLSPFSGNGLWFAVTIAALSFMILGIVVLLVEMYFAWDSL